MINRIIELIKKNNIDTWLITQANKESMELFFVKKEMVMRRIKKVTDVSATIFNDFEKDGQKMRGSTIINFAPGLTDEEISEKLKSAYYAASFVNNAYYDFPAGVKDTSAKSSGSLFDNSREENARLMTAALFIEDNNPSAYLNSAEMFVNESKVNIKSSFGTDVSYTKRSVTGEFVTQCKEPQDVETYQDFYYEDLKTEALAAKVKNALEMSRDRALATNAPKAGKYRVILSGQYVKTIMEYYMDRSTSSMVYPKYSNYQVGDDVQGENITGDLLNIDIIADTPYSSEGIPMKDRTLISNGTLKLIHGNVRFGYYIGIEPIGYYDSIRIPAGKTSLENMKQQPYLHIVNFSDFQMDSLTGYFGGEIRLAYLFDGDKVTAVTGGSISGSISDIQKNWSFSSDMQVEKNYEGPYALCMNDITVAGC